MRRLTCFIIAVLAPLARGQTSDIVGDAKDFLPALQQSCRDYFSKIGQIEYTVQKTVTIAGGKPQEGNAAAHRYDGLFAYDGGNYRIENRLGTGAWEKQNRIVSNNGTEYMTYHYNEDRLYVQEFAKVPERPNEFPLRYANPFLTPFEFFSAKLSNDDFEEFSLSELKDESLPAKLASRVLSVAVDKENKTFVVDFAASKEAITGLESFYRVRFDPTKGYYPVAWSRLAKDGRPIVEYSVSDIRTIEDPKGKKLWFPHAARVSCFAKEVNRPLSKTPVEVSDYQIELKSLNRPLDSDLFTIDPATARTIYDRATGIIIAVPK